MLFLCNPISPEDFLGAYTIFLFIFLIYYPFVSMFLNISNNLLKEEKIREDIVNIIKREYKWLWALLSLFFMASPMCFIALPFFAMLLAFPMYFLVNFIFYFFNKKDYSLYERNLLLKFYGIPVFSIIILGIYFKFISYSSYYGNYFLQEIYDYYILGEGKTFFINIFTILIIFALIFYLFKYFEIKKETKAK